MDSVSPEFVRAWQLYFKQRGGIGPSLPPDVMPVVIMDDNSAGPYQPYRAWHASALGTIVAATRTTCAVFNADGGPPGGGVQGTQVVKSIVVVDRITAISTDGAVAAPFDLRIHTSDANNEALTGASSAALDLAGDPIGVGGFGATPQVGNVFVGVTNRALITAAAIVPVGNLLPVIVNGPFILQPQQILLVEQAALVGNLRCYFQGRYYGGA